MNLPGQVRADLLVAVGAGRECQVVDLQRLQAERRVQPGAVEGRAEARLVRVYLDACAFRGCFKVGARSSGGRMKDEGRRTKEEG